MRRSSNPRWSGWVDVRGVPVHVIAEQRPDAKAIEAIAEIVDLLAQEKLRREARGADDDDTFDG